MEIKDIKIGDVLKNILTHTYVEVIDKVDDLLLVKNPINNDSTFHIYVGGKGISNDFNNYVKLKNSELKLYKSSERRIYWLDIKNNDYGDEILNNTEEFITKAGNEGNVATLEYFIRALNSNEINVNNCIFKIE